MAVNNLNSGVGIQPTIVDAKGDLIAGTANDAVNRLAVGTNGQVLIADSGETTGLKWNDPGSVGGLVHINTTSTSGVTAINLNNVFSSTYDNYKVVIEGNSASRGELFFRMRASGTDDTGSNYIYAFYYRDGSGFNSVYTAGAGSSIIGYLEASPHRSLVTLEISNPFKALRTGIRSQSVGVGTITGTNATNTWDFGNAHGLTTSYDGFTVFSASNLDLNVRVYGYRN